MRRFAGVVLAGLLVWGANAPAFASHGDNDHVAFGQTITVDEGETAGDIVCAFCTVRLQGNMQGDLVTFFGRVELGEGRSVSGDAVAFGGGLGMKKGSQIRGDLVLFGGDFDQDAEATVHGDRVVLAGAGWLLLLLIPLAIPVGFVWFIVWLVRRGRYRVPAYPGGRY